MVLSMKWRNSHTWEVYVKMHWRHRPKCGGNTKKSYVNFQGWAADRLWKSKITGRATKVKIFNSSVKKVLDN